MKLIDLRIREDLEEITDKATEKFSAFLMQHADFGHYMPEFHQQGRFFCYSMVSDDEEYVATLEGYIDEETDEAVLGEVVVKELF